MTTEKGETMSTTELIAEARRQTECRCSDAPEQDCGRHGDSYSRLIADLADALETVTTPTEADQDAMDEIINAHALTTGLPVPSNPNRRRALCSCGLGLFYEGGEYNALHWHRAHLSDALLAAGFSRHAQPETEWEYAGDHGDGSLCLCDSLADALVGHSRESVVKRAVGPWLPVDPEEA